MPVPLPPIPGQAPGAQPGGQPGLPGALNLPKTPAGGASGPGASPMVSPGGGEGMKAHVEQGIREHIKGILTLLARLEPNSKEFKTLARAMNDLVSIFGKPADVSGAPKPAAPIGNAPAPGIGGPPKGLPGPQMQAQGGPPPM